MTNSEIELVRSFIEPILDCKIDSVDGDIFNQCFEEISRNNEKNSLWRDQWGNWEFAFGKSYVQGNLCKPWLDQSLLSKYSHIKRKNLWPNNKKFALCLTHDVDLLLINSFASSSIRTLKTIVKAVSSNLSIKDNLKVLYSTLIHILWAMNQKKDKLDYKKWMELEERYNFHSTFFIFPEYVSKRHEWDCVYHFADTTFFDNKEMTIATMMKEISKSGWEIGLHGSINSATEEGMLFEQKKQIENVLQEKIVSTRQHFLRYDIAKTPKLQSEAGFLIDSTQGFNRAIGFRAGTSFPYPTYNHDAESMLPIWQVPQHIMDGALFGNNSLEYNEELAIENCIQLMNEVEKVGGCLTLSWHPNSMKIDKYWHVYEKLLDEAYKRNAWGCSTGELYNWWVKINI